jgi:hypothetical protein
MWGLGFLCREDGRTSFHNLSSEFVNKTQRENVPNAEMLIVASGSPLRKLESSVSFSAFPQKCPQKAIG